jgi:phosphatidylinositol glycan class A protein
MTQNSPLIERLRRYYGCGVYAGKIFCMVMALDYLFWIFLEFIFPREAIERAQTFPYKKYQSFDKHRRFDTANKDKQA